MLDCRSCFFKSDFIWRFYAQMLEQKEKNMFYSENEQEALNSTNKQQKSQSFF